MWASWNHSKGPGTPTHLAYFGVVQVSLAYTALYITHTHFYHVERSWNDITCSMTAVPIPFRARRVNGPESTCPHTHTPDSNVAARRDWMSQERGGA